jgi:hypothetical protein
VQVKYATSEKGVIRVERHSRSLTNGKILRTKHYTADYASVRWSSGACRTRTGGLVDANHALFQLS